MRFSELAAISRGASDDWFDPMLSEDTPLYIDPLLVFESEDPLFADARDSVVQFFATCRDLVRQADGRRGPAWEKAVRLLIFPEPKEFALGLAMGSPFGSGTEKFYGEQMAESLDLIGRALSRELNYVETFALFMPGLGVDRISDIFCNILKSHFIAYTRQVCARHDVRVKPVPVSNAGWSSQSGRWINSQLNLPVSPVTKRAVLLTPERFLQCIPQRVTADGFYRWAESNANEVLRQDLNFNLAEDISTAKRKDRGRQLARYRPDVAFAFVDEVTENAVPQPYDVRADPDLFVQWYEAGRDAGRKESVIRPVAQPTEENFHAWLGGLIDRFQHAVEESDLWLSFWNDNFTKGRKEVIVQAVAGQLWVEMCKNADVDISREADAGRGPVDFKFSAGWQRRALIEVKLLRSTKLVQGAQAQLPQYLRSEDVRSAYYVCVGYTDSDLSDRRLKRVREACAAFADRSNRVITPRFIDARPKLSASNL